MTSKTTYPRHFYVLASGLTVNLGERAGGVLYRGQTFEVTEEQYRETLDKSGRSWLDMTADEQEKRWGVQRFAEGTELPEDIRFVGDDDFAVRLIRRENETRAARKIVDDDERKAELKRINALYGAQDSGQRTITEY